MLAWNSSKLNASSGHWRLAAPLKKKLLASSFLRSSLTTMMGRCNLSDPSKGWLSGFGAYNSAAQRVFEKKSLMSRMKWRFWSRDICLKANLNYVDQTSWMSVLEVTKKTVLSCGRRMSETKPAWKIKQPRLNKHTIALSVLHNSAYRSSVWVGHGHTTVCTIPKETTHSNMNSSKKEITSAWCTPFKWHPIGFS